MDFNQQNYKHQNCDLIPYFSELLEMYNAVDQIPFFESSEGNTSQADQQAGNNISDVVQHVLEMVHINSEQEKQCSYEHNGVAFKSTSLNSSKEADLPRNMKQRIKWTQDLHQRFVESVDRLGGVEKATPRAILKLMNSNMLTIFHVKSHLQKYRTSKYIAEYTKGKLEKRTTLDGTSQLDMKIGIMQIKETLQHINKSLHEQVEIQQNLQLMIEEQGKQLKTMLEQQQQIRNDNVFTKSLQINSDIGPILQNNIDPCNSCNINGDDHFSITDGSGSSHSQSDL